MKRMLALSAFATFLATTASASTTLEVGPGKTYADIASAIAAAQDGDTVLVHDGVYEISAQIEVTKAITLKSVNGAEQTEIRQTAARTKTVGVSRCVFVNNADAVVDGFTISGGFIYYESSDNFAYNGAGAAIDSNGGLIQNCTITNCCIARSKTYGAGLAIRGANSKVLNCRIVGNVCGVPTSLSPWNVYGAGFYMASGLLQDCVIADNYLFAQNQGNGGGGYATGGKISGCSFLRNKIECRETESNGAGLYANGAVVVTNCVFAGNDTCWGSGGGIYAASTTKVYGSVFTGNSAALGGGVYVNGKDAKFYDSVLQDNLATKDAGTGESEWNAGDDVVFSNCVSTLPLTSKSVACRTGGVVFANPDGDDYSLPAVAIVRTSPVQVAGESMSFQAAIQTSLEGPVLARWKVDDGEWGVFASELDFTTSFASAGNHSVSLQVSANGLVLDPVVRHVHVSEKNYAVSTVDGFASALTEAEDGAVITVADGIYLVNREYILDKAVTVASANGAGKTEFRRTDISHKDNDGTWNTKYSPPFAPLEGRVFQLNHPRAVLKGVTVSGGWCYDGNQRWNLRKGAGGVLIAPLGGTLDSCVVTNCGAARYIYGGAVNALGKHAVVTNCIIRKNVNKGWQPRGAGLVISGGALVTHSEISENASSSGNSTVCGGVYGFGGRLSHCIVSGNTTDNHEIPAGAGIYSASTGFYVDNCLITGNVAANCGGGVYGTAGNFINCTIVGNSASQGGGVYGNNANLKFHNCIIQGNSVTADSTAGAPEWNGANTKYSYSLSPKALPTSDAGNVEGRATFEAGSIYKLAAGSAGYDAGNSETAEFAPYLTETDIDGNDRIWGEKIDIGCSEYFSTERYSASVIPPTGAIIHERAATFTASIVNPMQLALRCEWTVEGSADEPVAGETFVKVFEVPGPAKVKLTVWDGDTPGEFELDVYVAPHDVYVVTPESIVESGVKPAAPFWQPDCASTNLQLALDAAVDTTVIHVAPGTHLVWQELAVTKAVRLLSDSGADTTAIRRGNEGRKLTDVKYRVLSVNNPDAVVDGFAIENGYLNDQKVMGAGLYIGRLGGLVTNCIVRGNYMYANMYTYGGGVYMDGGVMANCIISNNINATQVANYDGAYGGGICLAGGVLRNSIVSGNKLMLNLNQRVHTDTTGGGVALIGGSLVNCLIAGNYSDGNAAGVVLMNPLGGGRISSMTNCTVTANIAYNENAGAGLRFYQARTSDRFEVVNTLVSGNLGNNGTQANDEIAGAEYGTMTACYDGGSPLFRNPERGDYRLLRHSPCLNAGIGDGWEEGDVDLAGNRRVVGRSVDIGCYEHQMLGLTVFVK